MRSYSLKKLTNSDGSFIISYILPPQLSQKTKQMIINNLSAISHVFETSHIPILHVFETFHIPILHVFEVLAKKLGQKKAASSVLRWHTPDAYRCYEKIVRRVD